ncbi:ATP-binding cassette subfamily B protein [Actinoalloteichus hoggarensis]|uniref:Iron import ATP-binding/permease protein IrtA n=1 Tax=Actinoalloteichus hoggarensis TaxID=1470176 RepID=A0A221W490_9PSEU|nr:ABC transporter ATP-binding protein [Actinoalloteichus hoggarensis]ASO20584.1 Iron import ATP-binding/permease protein IrtA [Actinoalloteichus hoggarensis]MBB5923625.1 ATP-binding cassette subfamily B protein [Actinoalloteichus hoggarensis]
MTLLRPVRGTLAVAVVLQALAAALTVIPLIMVSEIGMVLLDRSSDTTVWPSVAVGVAATIAALLLSAAANLMSHLADNRLQHHLRGGMAERLSRVPLGRLLADGPTRFGKVLHDDVHSLHHLVAHALLDIVSLVVTPLTALVYLLLIDWRLALISMIPLLLGVVLFARAMSGSADQFADYARAQQEINAGVSEFVDGIAVVKTFGAHRRAHRRFLAAADAFHDFFSTWAGRTTTITAASQSVVSAPAVLILVMCAGAVMIIAGWMPAAAIVPFALLAPPLAAPMATIGTRLQNLRGGMSAARAVTELLNEPVLPAPSGPGRIEGTEVRVKEVSFAYRADADDVLRGVSLDLRPGTVTALVGPSGAGKSTLAMLVARFHDVTAGSITLGGTDVRDLDTTTLYRNIGFVFQDVALLRTSVLENIRLGRPEATEAEVRAAAEAARIHERILAAPRGYDSVIGTELRLSGGEAQRLSIARALLADTPLLILDEATALADPHAEAQIQDALSALTAHRTLLVIAHRLSTITRADQILVLDEGRVVERGRHDDLLAARGRYARMWQAQQRPASVPDPIRVAAPGSAQADEELST